MKVTVSSVGRLKAGPERVLFERFIDRARRAGKSLGLTFDDRESTESPARNPATRKNEEAAALLASVQPGATLVALDEGGKSLDSRAFAGRLVAWRDEGVRDVVFVIGGPDGLAPAVLDKADLRLALGAMTWPHQVVRVMLAEQLYRAVTILSGHPYHRD
jgi:23S rRNA (pseudouridine1915-N3)-methyltransferase